MKNDLHLPLPKLSPRELALDLACDHVKAMDVHDLTVILGVFADRCRDLDEVAAEECVQEAVDLLGMTDDRDDDYRMEVLEMLAEMNATRKPE